MAPLNQWYVAAFGSEVGAKLFARTICGRPMVLFRAPDGAAVALEDRCPHRYVPLSRGELIGDLVQCAYHGLTLDRTGQCVRIPGQDSIPRGARVHAYPLVERWRFLWVWLGDPALADPALIPELTENDHPGWAVIEGEVLHTRADYRRLIDNLLDPGHVSFVHRSTLGTASVADIPVTTTRDGDRVTVARWILDQGAAPIYAALGGFTGPVDRWQLITYQPASCVTVDMGSAVAGTGAPQGDRSRGITLKSFNLITPEDVGSCFYFWTHVRNFGLSDDGVARRIRDGFSTAFSEDVEIVEMVEAGQRRFPDAHPVDIAHDRGPNLARAVIERLAAAEARAP
jgi:phenylpropionate dioxygenase-like ring-hydroxylating dioxygenase large terminal subunit